MSACAVHSKGGNVPGRKGPHVFWDGGINRKGTGKQLKHRFAVDKFGQERKKQISHLVEYLWGYVYSPTLGGGKQSTSSTRPETV